jgi:cytochrome c
MSDLRFNSIAGAVLASGLAVMGLRWGAEEVFHPHYSEKLPLALDVSASTSPGGGEETAAAGPPDFGRLFADEAQLTSLLERGAKVHKVCSSCHTDTPDRANKTGPGLYGVFGRAAGSHAGFGYSDAMKAYGKPWSYDSLYAFLAAPAKYIPGTAMSFAGVKKSEDRVALVAYLRSLSPSPAPLPAPLPEAAPAETAATDATTTDAATEATASTPSETPNAPAHAPSTP